MNAPAAAEGDEDDGPMSPPQNEREYLLSLKEKEVRELKEQTDRLRRELHEVVATRAKIDRLFTRSVYFTCV